MTLNKSSQWFFEAPWGKLAMVSWGSPSNPPVLLLHGFMDSAATFIPLIEKLPKSYYYVGADLPGHGLSDPFPVGFQPSQAHMIEVLRIVAERMNWKKFIFIGHSMAYVLGMFYNNAYPNKISKMINIDAPPPVSAYFVQNVSHSAWYSLLYDDYYRNYKRYNFTPGRLYTMEEAVNAVVRNRNISEEDAEIILSRNLIPVGKEKYRTSWDQKVRKMTNIPISREMLFSILTTNSPPTLMITATEFNNSEQSKKWTLKLMNDIQQACKNHYTVYVTGNHDIHITHSKDVAAHIEAFLKRQLSVKIPSKL